MPEIAPSHRGCIPRMKYKVPSAHMSLYHQMGSQMVQSFLHSSPVCPDRHTHKPVYVWCVQKRKHLCTVCKWCGPIILQQQWQNPKDKRERVFFVMSKMSSEHTPEAASEIMLVQWFPSISDNGTKAISREACGATSENFFKSHRNQLLCTLNTTTV